jgi:Tfp pilus assembly protein PilE
MRTHSSRRSREGLSLTELIVLVAVIGVLDVVFLPYFARPKVNSTRIKCVSNLKNVGLAFRIFATDNNDLFPPALMMSNGVEMAKIDALSVFRTLSNELSTPGAFVLPE